MIYLLDTNTCIRFLNGTSEKVRERVLDASPNEIVLCSVVKAELFYGAFKSAKIKRNLKRIEVFTNRFVSLPFDDSAARAYGKVRRRVERLGITIGPNDLLISAIALANRAILVTHNVGEFSRVKRLKVEDWE